ncbi:hypothetical protein H6G80_23475 [Nostoc sp. FACHB-87]|uniref:hypothetical protein n=1 Tax=Nostocales TaxID=1161 RepID=UPI001688F0E1|nr:MULTISPECIES: hypothetical protein [Nostocales]MBD2301093.1 hypothetical protein [Nostoc sp. FACHB-190]MBD2457023.1 hypothetical protein [Nostoc sp. FACHB-87]MBD2477065.1 hypothetical protein [Anabaena sp. FACHB-83]MBD2491196.1 hypothetical protein [Aulosira sp. FACHB-615]
MRTVVNLTRESLVSEIKSVLDTYAYYPYQETFAIPELRQELIDFVISRIPCFYNEELDREFPLQNIIKDAPIEQKFPRSPLEQKLHLQNLIHQGIFAIMQDKSAWINNHLCSTVEPGCEPSQWFG